MIIGVDIGGTKTLVATFDAKGSILNEKEFATPSDYSDFLETFTHCVETIAHKSNILCCVAVPGLLDRKKGIVHSLGNLPWKEEHIAHDLQLVLGSQKLYIENDSKLAGLSEVRSLNQIPNRALYITISTGIGGALLINGDLSKDMTDMELGKSPLFFQDDLRHWEDFASGRAFYEHYGKSGDETGDDPILWQEYVNSRLGPGLTVACSYLQVDTIIFGGGLGHHSAKFSSYLGPYLDERLHSIIKRPTRLLSAKRGKNAVIYGCYEYVKDRS